MYVHPLIYNNIPVLYAKTSKYRTGLQILNIMQIIVLVILYSKDNCTKEDFKDTEVILIIDNKQFMKDNPI